MLTKGQKTTIIVIVATVVILIGYDIAAVVFSGEGATISVVISKFSHVYPAIPFAFGFLMGHLFAQNEES